MAEISYAGHPLLIPSRSVQDWIEQYYTWEDFDHFTQPALSRSLPINQPPPPPARLNQLYWPTGATRWGRFYGLADSSAKYQIVSDEQYLRAATTPRNLVLQAKHEYDSETDVTLTIPMSLLPPRPLSAMLYGKTEAELWLIPLVDQRYWWQFEGSAELSVTASTTWANLFDTLDDNLGVTIETETVDTDYQEPDPASFTREHYPVPILLDMAAHSVGQRIVVELDGDVKTQSWGAARDQFATNQARLTSWAAGGEFLDKLHAPEQVIVSFPKIRHHVPRIDGDRYDYTKTPAANDFDSNQNEVAPGTEKLIRSTAYADFTGGGGTPDNNTNLDAMAGQIATDYYGSLLKAYDFRWNSLAEWNPIAYDDHILWTIGRLRDGDEGSGDYDISTRVRSSPHNLDVEQQFQQEVDPVYDVTDTFKMAKNDSSLSVGASGTCSVYSDTSTDSGDNVTAYYDWGDTGASNLGANTELILQFFQDNDRWQVVGWACS